MSTLVDRSANFSMEGWLGTDARHLTALLAFGDRHAEQGVAEEDLEYLRWTISQQISLLKRLVAGQGGVHERQAEVSATAECPTRPRVARALTEPRATALPRRGDGALAVIDRVMADIGGAEREMCLRLDADLASIAVFDSTFSDSWGEHVDRWEPELAGNTNAERRLLAVLAYRKVQLVESADVAAELAARAIAGGHLIAEGVSSPPLFAAGIALGLSGRSTAAEALFGEIAARAREDGSRATLSAAIGQRGVERYRQGDLGSALGDLEAAVRETQGQPWEAVIDDSRAYLLRVRADRGELGTAEYELQEWGATGALPDTALGNRLLVERGRLHLARGRCREALHDLHRVRRRLADRGGSLLFEWRHPAALAHHRLGEAQEALELAHQDLEIATAWGAPRQLGTALGTLGLIEGGERAIKRLRQAVEILEASPARLGCARALIDLGAALRRAGHPRRARVQQRAGLDLALQCGSRSLAEFAEQELAATGLRRRGRTLGSGPEKLTPSEQRVARMAVNGLSNPEIARALFVTRKTVEMHLGNSYRKLRISSRGELGLALDRG